MDLFFFDPSKIMAYAVNRKYIVTDSCDHENEHLKLMTCKGNIITAEEALEDVLCTRLSAKYTYLENQCSKLLEKKTLLFFLTILFNA